MRTVYEHGWRYVNITAATLFADRMMSNTMYYQIPILHDMRSPNGFDYLIRMLPLSSIEHLHTDPGRY